MRHRGIEYVRGGAKEFAKLLGASAVMGVLFAPQAVNHALETTTVETTFGEFPVELSYQPDTTSVDFLNSGKIYLKKTYDGIGVQAKVTGIPEITSSNPLDIISKKRIAAYAGAITDSEETVKNYESELRSATIDNIVDYEKYPVLFGGLALYMLGATIASKNALRRRDEKEPLPITTLTTVGIASLAMAASLTTATYNNDQWREQHKAPADTVKIDALDATPLEGATTDLQLYTFTRSLVTSVMNLRERSGRELDKYLETARPALREKLFALAPPKEHEEMLFVVTDMHGSVAGTELARETIEVLHERFGDDAMKNVLNVGDTVYDPELQRGSIQDQAKLNPSGSVIMVAGNHDIGNTQKYAEDDGMTVLNGEKTAGGMSFYGKPDPMQTPMFAVSSFPDSKENEETLGEQVLKETDEHAVDVVALHQPAAVQSYLGMRQSIRGYIRTARDLTACNSDILVNDTHAGLIAAGHWHINFPVQMFCHADGTWSVLNVQGTGGGANGSGTINNWSAPSARPQEDVSFRVFYKNTKYDSFTGYADIVVKPDGIVQPIVRRDIGTESGAPFGNAEGMNKTKKSADKKDDVRAGGQR